MLKTTILPERSTLEQLGVNNDEVNRFDISDDVKHAKKSKKTSKS